MELLGEHVLPVLRREFEALRPRHVPPEPPRRPAPPLNPDPSTSAREAVGV
jgi:hypothetical protein